MSTEKIRDASAVLAEASRSVEGEEADRLKDQAESLSSLAERDRGPDHGRIARHQQKLKDIQGDHPSTADAVDEANALLNEYRETIDGV